MAGTRKPKDTRAKKKTPKTRAAAAHAKASAAIRRENLKIRKTLIARRQVILDHIDDINLASRQGEPSEPGDVGDSAMASLEMDVTAGILRSETQELQAISDALSRIEQGTYGICEDCGKRIPVARLKAVPQATQCLACKMQHEREQPRTASGGRWRPAVTRLSPQRDAEEDSPETQR